MYLNAFKLVSDVRRLAAANPQETGTRFEYFNPDGTCGCLLGHAMALQGITPTHPDMADGANHVGIAFFPVRGREMKWLRAAQRAQDRGLSWGEAVRAADEYEASAVCTHTGPPCAP